MIWIPIWIQFFSYKILLCTPRFYKLKFIEKKLYTKNLYTEILYTNFTCLSWISIWIQFFHTKYCFIRVSTYKVLCVQSFHVYISMYKVYILKYVFLFCCFFLKSTPYGTGAPRPHVGNCALSPHFPYGSIQFGRKIKGSGISWQKILAFSSQLHPSISCKNGENIQNCIMIYNRKHFTNILH